MVSINSGIFKHYFDTVNYLIEEPHIGREITLVYEVTQPRQSNTYDLTFVEIDTNTSVKQELIKVRMYHSPKDWMKTSGVEFVDGRVQIIGYITDLDKIARCSYVLYNGQKFKLTSQPQRHGFGHSYFLAYLDLI